ncbi:potassium transporter TrkA [Natrinema versiforme]|uniref:Potassium transporter TrkA n=1 Tax=Natrinema versiforme TaxID=88724 RepID=A0A4P8WMR9_9EURY|nr:potassium transporter TrkA [Natrinema versiforme]QCS44635.1 potassium transporter TrkA [Natrinema versiforme]
MKVFETHLPGVGQRYRISFPDGGTFTIVIHNDGSRRVFWGSDSDSDSEKLFTATERDAQKIAEIFEGVFFDPVADDLDDALSGAQIKWVAIPDDSPIAAITNRAATSAGSVTIQSTTAAHNHRRTTTG